MSWQSQANLSSLQTHQKLTFIQTVKGVIMLNRQLDLRLALDLGLVQIWFLLHLVFLLFTGYLLNCIYKIEKKGSWVASSGSTAGSILMVQVRAPKFFFPFCQP